MAILPTRFGFGVALRFNADPAVEPPSAQAVAARCVCVAPGRLGTCRGERPWLGDVDPNGCAHKLRLLIRTATNAYFPQFATIISLPTSEDRLTELVRDHLNDLRNAQSAQEIAFVKRFNERVRATLEAYSDDEIFARVRRLVEVVAADAKEPAKLAEFEVFASGRPTIGDNAPESRLFARALDRSIWDGNQTLDLTAVAQGSHGENARNRARHKQCTTRTRPRQRSRSKR